MVRLVTLLGLLSAYAWSQGPVREMSAAAIIGQLMPGFYDGYLYACEPRHIITLFGPDGQIVLTLPIQGRGNGGTSVASVAIDSDRTLAVGWSELHDAGIDIRDLSGNLIRSINTGRFVPTHVSFGTDHCCGRLVGNALQPIRADPINRITTPSGSIPVRETRLGLTYSAYCFHMD